MPRERVMRVRSFSSNRNIAERSPRAAASITKWVASDDLPVPAAPISRVLVPRSRPPPSSWSIAGRPLLTGVVSAFAPMMRGDQAREHAHAAGLDHVVVVAAAERPPAHLVDPQAAAIAAEFRPQLVQPDDAVHDGVHVQALVGHLAFVEQQHGAAAAGEVLLQRQHLAAQPQDGARQQPDFGQRVEHHARRLQAFDLLQDAAGRVGQFHLGGMEHRVLVVRIELVAEREQLVDVDAVQGPAVGGGDLAQLLLGFRQGDVQHRLAARGALAQELHGHRGLARAGHALEQVQAIRGQPAIEDDVQPGHAGAHRCRRRHRGICLHRRALESVVARCHLGDGDESNGVVNILCTTLKRWRPASAILVRVRAHRGPRYADKGAAMTSGGGARRRRRRLSGDACGAPVSVPGHDFEVPCAASCFRHRAGAGRLSPGAGAGAGRPRSRRHARHQPVAARRAADALRRGGGAACRIVEFDGKVTVGIEVLAPASSITLNAVDLTFASGRLLPASGKGNVAPPKVSTDDKAQTATFTFAEPLPVGSYKLAMDYTGKIGTQANGLFAIDYETKAGKKRALYTQFEAPDARRMIPSWDEPAYKATFTLEATVPSTQMAVSNMPVVERSDAGKADAGALRAVAEDVDLPAVLRRRRFRPRDREVGPDRARRRHAEGQGRPGRFALDSSVDVLREYNDYFGVDYPLPKLDNIASPGGSQFFGAMENWGAILTFEYTLLLDPTISTASDKQRVFGVAAHEIAHQWFGNLVTMQWWDDLWLNEGFASWMASRTTVTLHPEWKPR